ncbi:hypothetical protein ABFX02_04G227100 [Erythranthe guttata]
MTISDLMDCTSERSVALLAKVVEIDCESKWYPSCSTCFRKVDRNGVQFYCEKCIDNVPAIPRYRIQVMVFDVTGSISLVMFDKVVTEIIGKKAADILGDLGKEDLSDTVPNEFDVLIDKEFIFKVDIGAMNISKNWSVYTAKTVSGDDELIQKFRAMHSIQPCSDEDDQSVGNDVQQQDDNLDAFSSHGDGATPSSKSLKKKTIEDGVDTFEMSDDGATQMSSTKVLKKIKLEKE